MHFLNKKNLIFFAAIIILALFFWFSFKLQGILSKTLLYSDYFISNHPFFSIFAFVLLAAFSTVFSIFSSVFLVPLAVNSWDNLITSLLLIIGWFLGGVVAYFIGKYLGRRIASYFISPERIIYYENLISNKMKFHLILLFRLVAPDEIPSYLLGILRYDFLKYSLITFLVQLPVAFGAVYASKLFIERKILMFLGFMVVFLIVIRITYYYFKKHFPRFHED
jgi:uncharacterized membrane protein YdjX (TVP38/TMEM64 family)